jgi:hypothetical protein
VKSKRLIFTADPFRKETATAIAIIPENGNNIVIASSLRRIVSPASKFLVKQILRYINDVTYDRMPDHFGPHFTLK